MPGFGRRPAGGSRRCLGGERLVNLLVEDQSEAGSDGAHRLDLEPFACRWYRVGGLGYALRRVRE